ncbi:MAG: leucine--tRNA ligase [Ottowia sp.]|nr:leucine--tRNA ligase [Ottowia sp.]
MQEKYLPAAIEAAVQAVWQADKAYITVEEARDAQGNIKPPFYACSMLPYPSGKLHMGHVRNYTINDVMARYLRMNGYNVLMPMGWDAFGMPAENAALNNNIAPATWTYDNIASMKKQMQSMGFAIDWSREIATCDPSYYKWNQWFFLKMREAGIAYRKTGVVNWDPVDQTVLANEQVIDGCGWRSGARVEKREIPMYYLNITRYAQALLDDLEPLAWPERVKHMQRNWIGKSEGVRFAFPHHIKDHEGLLIQDGKLFVFTTRIDTLMGVSFCAVAPEHPLALHAARSQPQLAAFIARCKQGSVMEADLATMEKEGMATGLHVIHPVSGAMIPVWVGNYVLMSYGDGAVMGVPAHDERDFAFASKYALPIQQVIALPDQVFSTQTWQSAYAEPGTLVASGQYTGLPCAMAVEAITRDLHKQGLGEKKISYRLRDWGISRQRYWGTPIPIIHCEQCGEVPVPEKDLPVVLPQDCIPDGSGNPLNKRADFIHCLCPSCGQPARRETDTMDTFVDSSWYALRYTCPDANTIIDARTDYWLPMNQYIGGIEHAILHLLYARFWTKVMRDMGLVKFGEPFENLLTQGMVLNETYYRDKPGSKKEWINPIDVELQLDDRGRPLGAYLKADGKPVTIGGVEKMSKSKNNGIDPQALIDQYGADTARLFVMFAAPPEAQLEWSDTGVEGAARFLRRLWQFAYAHRDAQTDDATSLDDRARLALSEEAQTLRRDIYKALKQANFDFQRVQYNTVVSAAMKMLNALEAAKNVEAVVRYACFGILLRILAPVVPHITQTIWQALGYHTHMGRLLDAPWPQVDESALVQNELELALQIGGKLRGTFKVPANADRQAIEILANTCEVVQKHLQKSGGKIGKTIVVPGRLANVIILSPAS